MALLRVVSAVPGASRLDLSIGTQKVAAAVEYKAITPFGEVASGRQTLTLRPAGLDTAEPLAEQTETLRAGEHYTVVITPGEENGPATAIRVLEDPLDALDQNRATLRIVHAAADAGRLDAYIPGRSDAIAQSLEFQHASDFTELQPGSVAIELRPAQRTETMLRLSGQQLSAGGHYTVVVVGRTRIDPPLEYLVLEDRLTGG